jgi:hypothetical protein
MTLLQTIAFEFFKATLLAIVTFGVGQRVVAGYQIRNKRRELDIASLIQFEQAYAEYKEVWRLWKLANALNKQGEMQWDLLKRATAAEAKVDAIIVKIVIERTLSDAHKRQLGVFRQCFQRLRAQIRDGNDMKYDYKNPEYIAFNQFAAEVASLIDSDEKCTRPSPAAAAAQLHFVSGIRKEDWEAARDAMPTDEVVYAAVKTHAAARR